MTETPTTNREPFSWGAALLATVACLSRGATFLGALYLLLIAFFRADAVASTMDAGFQRQALLFSALLAPVLLSWLMIKAQPLARWRWAVARASCAAFLIIACLTVTAKDYVDANGHSAFVLQVLTLMLGLPLCKRMILNGIIVEVASKAALGVKDRDLPFWLTEECAELVEANLDGIVGRLAATIRTHHLEPAQIIPTSRKREANLRRADAEDFGGTKPVEPDGNNEPNGF